MRRTAEEEGFPELAVKFRVVGEIGNFEVHAENY